MTQDFFCPMGSEPQISAGKDYGPKKFSKRAGRVFTKRRQAGYVQRA